jgi:hypothetical protein
VHHGLRPIVLAHIRKIQERHSHSPDHPRRRGS